MKSSALSLLLCLLLLGGCAAPAEQGQIIVSPTVSPMTTATVAPTVTPVPHCIYSSRRNTGIGRRTGRWSNSPLCRIPLQQKPNCGSTMINRPRHSIPELCRSPAPWSTACPIPCGGIISGKSFRRFCRRAITSNSNGLPRFLRTTHNNGSAKGGQV